LEGERPQGKGGKKASSKTPPRNKRAISILKKGKKKVNRKNSSRQGKTHQQLLRRDPRRGVAISGEKFGVFVKRSNEDSHLPLKKNSPNPSIRGNGKGVGVSQKTLLFS